MFLSPLSGLKPATFPQLMASLGIPPVPNPILESQPRHELLISSAMMPILAFAASIFLSITLNPSLLQNLCKEALAPISDFHVSRPSEVWRCFPSAISEYKEVACLLMTINLLCCPIFIPRQILSKGVFQ